MTSDFESDQEPDRQGWSRRAARYTQLVSEGVDEGALHDLLVRHGAAILDRSVPYLVVAARNTTRSRLRRERRRTELESRTGDMPAAPRTFDPYQVAHLDDEVKSVLEALGEMDPAMSYPLWWHAAGFSDEEIQDLWEAHQLTRERPSLAAIRKRRQRAREALRRELR